MPKDTVETFCQKAQQAIAEGRNEDAQVHYKEALGLRPDLADAHYGMATVSFLLGQLALAAYHFREVTRLDPSRAGAYINLGAVYNRLDQLDDAVTALRRGIGLDHNRAEGYYNLGLVYRRKGQAELAVQAYREATRVNPRMADAHYNVANIFLEKMQFGLAVAHYRQALEIRPTWEKAQRGLEQAEASLKNIDSQHEVEKITEPPPKPEAAPARPAAVLDPDRVIDPMVHAEMLRNLHKVTVDSENQGRHFLKALETEIEPVLRELSNLLLFPDSPAAELNECMRKFETAMQNVRGIQENLQTSMERVRLVGEKFVRN